MVDLKDLEFNSIDKLVKDRSKFFEEFEPPTPHIFDIDPVRLRTPSHEELNNYKSASTFMNALAESAQNWKQKLPAGYQTAIIAILYGGIQIQVKTLSEVSFDGIRIEGVFNSGPCEMLAHQATVQILCHSEKITEEKPINPIGFIWSDREIRV